jgi:hypothetical protein
MDGDTNRSKDISATTDSGHNNRHSIPGNVWDFLFGLCHDLVQYPAGLPPGSFWGRFHLCVKAHGTGSARLCMHGATSESLISWCLIKQ